MYVLFVSAFFVLAGNADTLSVSDFIQAVLADVAVIDLLSYVSCAFGFLCGIILGSGFMR